ncbi:uncharacterized protein LOC134846538 isoform X2 [Symsagittifera roscoffensis]|uniref:uncharacterized protein LOC134846538 isoform X2 n=1 Tax=Symsagittifera roscoffensis TaxID=84072 RepID=UPI00307BE12E
MSSEMTESRIPRPMESERQSGGIGDFDGSEEDGLSKLQMLRNQFRSKIVEEKERKLNLLNKKQSGSVNKQNRKVTINGVVEEFSPDSNKQDRHLYGENNVYKESNVKSPQLGQRMQTDLAKFGGGNPSQKELEVRRRQAILDSLHKNREKKKVENIPYKAKGSVKMSYKGHLPPIPGSVKKSNSKTEHDLMTSRESTKRNSNLGEEEVDSENNLNSTVSNNPFASKPAIIKRKALPGVNKQSLQVPGGVTSEDSEITSDYNTSDKENTQQQLQMSHRNNENQIQPIAESENNALDRQPLRESHSSNNDSAGNRTLGSTTRSNEVAHTENAPNEVLSSRTVNKNDLTSQRQQLASGNSQRPRSVTAKDVLEISSQKRYSQDSSVPSNYDPQDPLLDSGSSSHIKVAHNVVISDTITDLESGLQIESQEKQRLDALQRLNKKTNDERTRSAKRLAETKPNKKPVDSSSEQNPEATTLPLNDEDESTARLSDSEISGQAMTLRERNDAAMSSVRRSESHRNSLIAKKGGIKSALVPNDSKTPSTSLKIGATPNQPNAAGGNDDLKDTINEMRKRERDLIETIKKQQEELELVRKQRFRQERIFKSSHHKKSDKFRSESESSRVLSTEEASQSELMNQNQNNYQPELSPKKKPTKVRLPPKRSVDIKEDPYYAQIAEKSTPLAIDMQKCPHCSRSFAPERYNKHVEICQNVQAKKRSEYDSTKHRLQGTGAEIFQNEESSQI